MADTDWTIDDAGRRHVATTARGLDALRDPLVNKGTAFTARERAELGLDGLLPPATEALQRQLDRAFAAIMEKPTALERHIGLVALQDTNETLYYRLLHEHVDDLLPLVYTPTVGDACRLHGRIYRRPRGVWITAEHRGRIAQVLANVRRDARLLVVTDNERILGLGDLGAGGMGISVGKLALYTVAAGIHPSVTLPVSVDVGTDTVAIRDDDLYLGVRQPRLRGPEYLALMDELVAAVQQVFPRALVQWEDLKKQTAFEVLERFEAVLPSFNDDIQGTAAVALAAVLSAARISGVPLVEQRIVILGGGAAGVGMARLIRDAMLLDGLSEADAKARLALLDSGGLIIDPDRQREPHKREFAWPPELAASRGVTAGARLLDVVRALRPTTLIGTSGQPGEFDEDVVRAMAAATPRPAIFPLSNPTSSSEAVPADLLRWTEGRALVATGSPFAPVELGGRRFVSSQANNVYVFPGVGLGCLAVGARRVLPAFFYAAAKELAASVAEADLATGALMPPLSALRAVSRRIALAVGRAAAQAGVAPQLSDETLERAVSREMWFPEYPTVAAG